MKWKINSKWNRFISTRKDSHASYHDEGLISATIGMMFIAGNSFRVLPMTGRTFVI